MPQFLPQIQSLGDLRRRELLQVLSAACGSLLLGSDVVGQFQEEPLDIHAPRFGATGIQRYRVGVRVVAEGGRCRDIYATLPVPKDWPEQRVRIVQEDTTTDVRHLRFRDVDNAARQMIVEIPDLPAGREARAIVTYELERSAILLPHTTNDLKLPTRSDRDVRLFLRPSPYIESRHTSIVRLMRETTQGKEGWEKVESIYDVVRQRVEYRNGELKGAARALKFTRWGDCEELTCFAMARAAYSCDNWG